MKTQAYGKSLSFFPTRDVTIFMSRLSVLEEKGLVLNTCTLSIEIIKFVPF